MQDNDSSGRTSKPAHRLCTDAAFLAALALRLPCFPCRADKTPACPHGFQDATTDPDVLRVLWRQFPGPLIGLATGEASGIDVLDIDAPRRSEAAAWYDVHCGEMPPTRIHRTRSGGLHLLFAHTAGLRCSAGRIAPGIDVRADGGYIVWWPAAGCRVLTDAPPAAWPTWLLIPLRRLSCSLARDAKLTIPDSRTLAKLVRFVARASEGGRNNATYWAACRAGEMVRSGLLNPHAAVALITEAATRTGLSREEAERTVWSGIHATGGMRHA